MNDKLVNKYLPNTSNKPKPNQPEIPKTPKDAQKAVETMAARLAVDVLDIDDKFREKGGRPNRHLDSAGAKARAALSKLHPDPKVISHFHSTFEKMVGNSLKNDIPTSVSNIIKMRANNHIPETGDE